MKIKIILVWLIVLNINSLLAQNNIIIEANVVDKEAKSPISFADYGFLEKNIKGVSTINGQFFLKYDETLIASSDIFTLKAVGYNTLNVTATQLYKFLANNKTIILEKSSIHQNQRPINKEKFIRGVVLSEQNIIQGATIKVKGTLHEVFTDVDGAFTIEGNINDVLVINYLGMKTKEMIIKNKEDLKIVLEPDGELLDEVLLKGKAKKEETIDLGLGMKKSFDELGYSVNVITEKEIKPYYTNLNDVIGGKFAGIPWINSGPGKTPIYKLRSSNSINNEVAAIYDVDGQIFDTNVKGNPQVPIIDVQNISSITVLKSLAATTKYGTLGRGGVIVIKTKTFSGTKAELKKPSALATGNDYTEQVQELDVLNHEPGYLQTLKNAKTFEEAKQIYKILKQTKDNLSITHYLDAAEYFLKWDNAYAMDIFSYIEDLAKDNAKALKSIAFKYEALNMYEEARLVYQNITLLRPSDAQSYRDLALIYVSTGYYNEAMRLYKQMLSNSIDGVDFSGLQQPIIDELMHLLAKHRSKVDYTDIPADVLATKFKQDLRIVFVWNNPTAEFELQFVNPKKKFFKWSHTKFDNRERMLDEIKKGYTTEAYIIDDADTGEWIINLESLNETPDINPNYLKYTIYKNYGLPNETKTVKVIQLESITQKVTLDKITYE
jgi:tetratricopeptide (TPR) repeat protein